METEPNKPTVEPTLAPSKTPEAAPAGPQPTHPTPAPPPAAKTVLEGTRTEREVALERDLRATQTRLCELEDENRQLKTLPTPQTPPAKQKKSWLEDGTII